MLKLLATINEILALTLLPTAVCNVHNNKMR